MATPVTLIPGDGIGPSISDATVQILEAAGADIAVGRAPGGPRGRVGARESDAGRHARLDPPHPGRAERPARDTRSGKGTARSTSPCVRPSTCMPTSGRRTSSCAAVRFDRVDIVLVRENTEGLYVGRRALYRRSVTIRAPPRSRWRSLRGVARSGVIRYAFEYAVSHHRRKVTLVHKANILKFSQGLFLDVGRQIAREYEPRGIAFEDKIVDAMAMNLVLRPERTT